MIEELNIDVKMRICETIREESGLAMSSRNIYLNEAEKKQAPAFYQALNEAKRLILEGILENPENVKNEMIKIIETNSPDSSLQYIAITDNSLLEDIKDLKKYKGDVLISLAAFFGKTRLIDNILFKK